MGTRSNTVVRERWDAEHDFRPVVNIYRQMDGYPSVQGKAIAQYLTGLTVVNGIGLAETKRIANGAGDLAAQLVVVLKSDQPVGGIYLQPADAALGSGDFSSLDNDYAYIVDVTGTDDVRVTVLRHGDMAKANLSVSQFTRFCSKDE